MKGGFTLVELIVVIVILGLLSLVAFPAITKVLNDSRNSAYDDQVAIIEKGAKAWGVEHPTQLPNSGVCKYLNINVLVSQGYISDIKNPKGGNLSGVVKVNFSSNQYVYKFVEGVSSISGCSSF